MATKKKQTLTENIISEAGSNIVGSLVVDNPEALEQMLSQHQPKRNWFVRLGYVNDVTASRMNKTNRLRPADNERFGRSLNDPMINDYLDSDAYKHSGEVVYGGNGKVLKASPYQPPQNPVANALMSVLDISLHWNARGYQEKMNWENSLRDKYLSVPRRLAQYVRSNDFRKRAVGYATDKGLDVDEVIAQAAEDAELAKLISKYVAKKNTNDGGGWTTDPITTIATHTGTASKPGTGNKAIRSYTPGVQKMTVKYYLIEGDEVREVSKDFKDFWEREFGKAPAAKPDSTLERIIARVSKWHFNDYLLSKVIYMTFSYEDQDGQNVKFTYVNKQFNIANHPAVVAQYFIDKFSKSKIMPESIGRAKGAIYTTEDVANVVSRIVEGLQLGSIEFDI